jgi:TfoX/Sxy family transcriptional regulator of competence genes
MAVDQELAARIRSLIALDPRVTEKRMFGGICFLLDGRILVGVRRNGALLVQCGAEAARAATQRDGVTPMRMGERHAANFIDVEDDSLETEEGLREWIALAERYLMTLPPKG